MVLSVPTTALVYLKLMEQHTVRKYCIHFTVTVFKYPVFHLFVLIRDQNVPLQIGPT